MKTWIISVVSLSLLLTLLELFTVEGKTKKLIAGIMKITFIFVLIQPIFSFLQIDTENYLMTDLDAQNSEQTVVYSDIFSEKSLENRLQEEGIDCTVNIITEKGEIQEISITLQNASINEKEGNIYIYSKQVIDVVTSFFDVDLEKIKVYA